MQPRGVGASSQAAAEFIAGAEVSAYSLMHSRATTLLDPLVDCAGSYRSHKGTLVCGWSYLVVIKRKA